MTEKSTASYINDAIRSLCKETGESLMCYVSDNSGDDFKVKRYGGVDIDPIIVFNSKIAKIVESLVDGDPIKEDDLERELLRLLILKRSGKIFAKALKEAEEEKVKLAKEESKLAKKMAQISNDVKKVTNNPEVKKRRRSTKSEDQSSISATPISGVIDDHIFHELAEAEKVIEKTTIRQAPVSGDTTSVVTDIVSVDSIEDFLEQEKLNAVNKIDDEPTI